MSEPPSDVWEQKVHNRIRPLRNIGTVTNEKPSNEHDKSGDVHEKMQKRLSGVVFIR